MAKVPRTGRRTTEGRVVGANSSKTRAVVIEKMITHRLYGRILRRSRKYAVHDEREMSKVGDLVRIQECRPLSKTKKWRVIEIL